MCCILAVVLLGCAKPIPENKLDYVGSWASADNRVNLVISADGRLEYSNNQPQKSSTLSVPIKSFEGNNFQAGVGPFSTEFTVSQPPKKDEQGNWFMVVDDYLLAKRAK
ncbi:hypothetical protein G8E00_12205 [Acinetobacter shaoyimingii]|uniref:Uncharacterized protein n=2 Tax=Acinetobacter shaoyimingii TaxID=2715164 RepID=A0A6G8S093_9GAMM|nr:hypothetical protein [Acinetobacter shaoyimingii]QIO07525.1 hypothetical protein G8E00_12205 [Acinetobacter shaoyimingii]